MLLVELEKTATNTDVLSGTDLDPIPYNGILTIWVASTVNTATLEVNMPGHKAGNTLLIRKRTDGIPLMKDDAPIVLPVTAQSKVKLVLGGTTGTCHFTAVLN